MSPEIPSDRLYAPTHEWIRVEEGTGTVGLSAPARDELGTVVHVELPAAGREVAREEPCALIESDKTASDLHAPVSGRILEINSALESDPGLLHRSPYRHGWLYRISLALPGELSQLLDAGAYRERVAGPG